MSPQNVSPQIARLYEEFLALSEDDREELVALIWNEMDGEELPADAELSPEWQAEIKARLEEIDRGEATLIPWEEVQRRLDEKYGPITD